MVAAGEALRILASSLTFDHPQRKEVYLVKLEPIKGAARTGVLLILALIWTAVAPLPSTATLPITDQDINGAVETLLFVDQYVPAYLINVATAEGIVTLSGTVDNLLARERAGQLAESIKGVRAVINRITVDPTPRPDAEIKADIEQALLDDPTVVRYDVSITVTGGVVTLTGHVDSATEQQLVPEVVKAVRGVKAVVNNIEFSLAEDGSRFDSEIITDVQRRLDMDIWVDAKLIKTSVSNAVVRLTGEAPSAVERTRATTDAWVTGVRAVDASGLIVAPWFGDLHQRTHAHPLKTDSAIAQDVNAAFRYDPRVGVTNVTVAVRYGVATLNGVVDNLATKRAAEADTYNTVGVWDVHDLIKVRPATIPPDAELAKRVEAAFRRDPYLELSPINVNVRHGIVTLSGVVDSIAERSQAVAVATRITGVAQVYNYIIAVPATERQLLNPPDLRYNLPPPMVAMPLADRNEQLRKAVEYQLSWNPYVGPASIQVAADNGIVTLTGTVDSWLESGVAEDSALKAGASKVVNNLTVSHQTK
jgi:osmotically-inducible protein OsmY